MNRAVIVKKEKRLSLQEGENLKKSERGPSFVLRKYKEGRTIKEGSVREKTEEIARERKRAGKRIQRVAMCSSWSSRGHSSLETNGTSWKGEKRGQVGEFAIREKWSSLKLFNGNRVSHFMEKGRKGGVYARIIASHQEKDAFLRKGERKAEIGGTEG